MTETASVECLFSLFPIVHYQSLFYALINEASFWQEFGFLMLNLSASPVTRFIPLRYDVIRIDQNT